MLSAPRPGRASKMMAFSSDVDLAALGRSGSSGSDGDAQRGAKAVPLTSQLYNTLVGPGPPCQTPALVFSGPPTPLPPPPPPPRYI